MHRGEFPCEIIFFAAPFLLTRMQELSDAKDGQSIKPAALQQQERSKAANCWCQALGQSLERGNDEGKRKLLELKSLELMSKQNCPTSKETGCRHTFSCTCRWICDTTQMTSHVNSTTALTANTPTAAA